MATFMDIHNLDGVTADAAAQAHAADLQAQGKHDVDICVTGSTRTRARCSA